MSEIDKQPAAASPSRVIFIDQARAFAIVMMIAGHTFDRFLAEPWRSGEPYDLYQFFRGVTSALFLMISGFSFVMASFRHFDDYTRWTPKLAARLHRILLILFLGYFLNRLGPTLSMFLARAEVDGLDPFLRFDVLQNIGFGLLLLHGIVFISRRQEVFWKAVITAAVAVFVAAPITYNAGVDSHLPVWLRPALNQFHQSMFPVVPFTGFLLLGAVFGWLFFRARADGSEGRVMIRMALFGAGLVMFEGVIRYLIPGGLFPYSPGAAFMPGYTFVRCGLAMLVIAGLYLLGTVWIVLRSGAFLLSKESLFIYFVHLPIIYNLRVGPVEGMIRNLSPIETLLVACGIIGAMFAVASGLSWMRRNHEADLNSLRHALIAGSLIQFLMWNSFTLLSAVVSLVCGAALVLLMRLHRSAKAAP